MFTELDDVLGRLQQGTSQLARSVIETTDTPEAEGFIISRKKNVLSKRTHKMKKTWESDEIARLFVTGPADPIAEPSHSYCQLCQRDVGALTHGLFEILRHHQDAKRFHMD